MAGRGCKSGSNHPVSSFLETGSLAEPLNGKSAWPGITERHLFLPLLLVLEGPVTTPGFHLVLNVGPHPACAAGTLPP